MADLVTGAMSRIIPKLYQLLEECSLQAGVKERISFLERELEHAQAALGKVAEVPWYQLDKQVQIWAGKVREASYDIEDVLDTFLVRVEGLESTEEKKSLRKYLKKMFKFFKKIKARRKISGDVMDIITHLKEVTEQYRRYKVDDIVARPATVSTIDPRLPALYTQLNKLVGVDKSSGELVSMLQTNPQRGDVSSMRMKIVSIVGVGGLGKTTLAKVVYDKIKGDFDRTAFIPVGRNPDLKKILKDIIMDLGVKDPDLHTLDERQLIDRLRNFFLDSKNRFLIVIDDIWEIASWEIIKLAIDDDKNCGGRIIITSRNMEVATKANEVYKLQPLPYESSIQLLNARIYGHEERQVDSQPDEISDKFIRKCGGIPLAIITMASLLAGKPRGKWSEIYRTFDFGHKDNKEAENTMRILSFSYYDLPSHLRTCLLYVSAFPEDYIIRKVPLVWMWVAEGFVQKQEGKGLFETGEGYFNDLINRSLIQEVERNYYGEHIHGCCVHDMVLDFIRTMSSDANFFTVFDNNDQGNVVRRLAHHNSTMGHSNLANMFDMSKLRSFIAPVWEIDTWAPISSFKLLRVLNIGYYRDGKFLDIGCLQIEHLGHLVHLRFLGVNGRWIKKIPEEIGSLKMLQTLDMMGSLVEEVPSSSSFPTQLVCLRIRFRITVSGSELFSVGRLTSLEELSIHMCSYARVGPLAKELGSLRELRVLRITNISWKDEEMQKDLMESVGQLDKLQHLKIQGPGAYTSFGAKMEFPLSGDLRTLAICEAKLWKLPSSLNHLCLLKLSHLDLCLKSMREQELKTLGELPELCFLGLDLWRSSATTISDISDSDVCYFPKLKLRHLRLRTALAMFVANNREDKKTVSFHIWDGQEDGDAPRISDELNNEGSGSIRESGGERAAAPPFMPRLHELDFQVRGKAIKGSRYSRVGEAGWRRNKPLYCSNLGLEFLSSLQEIRVGIDAVMSRATPEEEEHVKDALRRAAQVHPNHPTLHIGLSSCSAAYINWG